MKYVPMAALLLALPTVAYAQDQSAPFQGFYAGLEGGADNFELGANADLGIVDPDLAGASVVFDGLSANGFGGGVFAGYQHDVSVAYIAVEGFARLSSASMKASLGDDVDTYLLKAEAKESYGVAARLGLKVAPGTGVYGRVGWINTKFKVTLDDTVDRLTGSSTEDAIQYGAGFETMVGAKTALRAEYVFADYGNAGLGQGINLDSGSFNVGFAYRF